MAGTLPGLPGASEEAGSGVAVRSLFEHLVDDAAATRPEHPGLDAVLREHRRHRRAWYRDVVGALTVPASSVEALLGALEAGDRGLPLVLAADGSGLDGLRRARSALAEDDRLDVVGIDVPVPRGTSPAAGTLALLEALDFSVPARIGTTLEPGWDEALAVLATDGAEELAIDVRGEATAAGRFRADQDLAAVLRRGVDLDLTMRLVGGPDHAVRTADPATGAERHGLLNLLCAVRAALNGAQVPDLAAVVSERRPAPLASALRRMSEADAAVLRAFLAGCASSDVGALVEELVALGLLDPADEG